MGLWLVRDGIDPEEFWVRFGVSLVSIYASEIEPLCVVGLLDSGKDGRLWFMRRGWLFGN